jgi:hypothetical protein
MFASLLCGIAIEAALLFAVIKLESLRHLCELLLAPGWYFMSHNTFTLVFGLFVNALIYSIPFEMIRRSVAKKGQRSK